jgi:hypothetical protein
LGTKMMSGEVQHWCRRAPDVDHIAARSV